MTSSVILLQTLNTYSDNGSDLFYPSSGSYMVVLKLCIIIMFLNFLSAIKEDIYYEKANLKEFANQI